MILDVKRTDVRLTGNAGGAQMAHAIQLVQPRGAVPDLRPGMRRGAYGSSRSRRLSVVSGAIPQAACRPQVGNGASGLHQLDRVCHLRTSCTSREANVCSLHVEDHGRTPVRLSTWTRTYVPGVTVRRAGLGVQVGCDSPGVTARVRQPGCDSPGATNQVRQKPLQ